MGFAFGYVRDIDLSWPFVVVSKQHYWISDPEDPLYNQMTQQTPRTDNFEYLRRDDEVYRYAAVVEYNMRPIEKYKGSAIFFHIESGFDRGTAGCISVTRRKTVEVLQWFDPQKVPYMLSRKLCRTRGADLSITTENVFATKRDGSLPLRESRI